MDADWFRAQLVENLSLKVERIDKETNVLNSAVSLVFVIQNKDIELLFIQRAKHPKDPWSGHIAFPGGGYEKTDKELLITAIRETQEELSIYLNTSDCVGSLPQVFGPIVGNKKIVSITPFIFLLSHKPELSPNYEVENGFWLSLDKLIKEENVRTFEHPSETAYEMKGIELGMNSETLLWGLSLEVLYKLFHKIELPTEQELITFQKIT